MKLAFITLTIFLVLPIQIKAQNMEARKINSNRFKRLYQMNDSVFRSEQPSRKGFRELEAMGVKTIINFRRLKDDARKAKGTQLYLERIPLKSSELKDSDIIDVLKLIHNAEKPVLIHCYHGSDRTGVISAAYRVIFEDWTKEKAIEEMRSSDFGYHEKWYPFLVDIIMDLDKDKIKQELGIN